MKWLFLFTSALGLAASLPSVLVPAETNHSSLPDNMSTTIDHVDDQVLVTMEEKHAEIVCSRDMLGEVSQSYDIDIPLDKLPPGEDNALREEVKAQCGQGVSQAVIESVLKHYTMLWWVDDDSCKPVILKEHCRMVQDKSHNQYADSVNVLPDSPVAVSCPQDALHQLSLAGHYKHMLTCSVSGMISESKIVEYCQLPTAEQQKGDERPLAYAILVHKSAKRAARLVHRLYNETDLIVVHVDAGSHVTRDSVAEEIGNQFCANGESQPCPLPLNIHVISRVSVIWGSISVYDALQEAVKDLLAMSGRWSHVINLSESDYPLQPVSHMKRFLSTHGAGVNFLDIHNPATALNDKRWRGREASVHCGGKSYPVHLLRPPPSVPVFDGSMWTVMTRDFWAEMLLTERGTHLRETIRGYVQGLDIPDEAMQQTMVMASSQCVKVCNANLRVENWQGEASPSFYLPEDVPNLAHSHSFFARKFDDDHVLDLMDEMIAQKN